MRLTILGTSSALPDPQRMQSGCLLEKSGQLAVIDCGSGVLARLSSLTVNWAALDTFFLTHRHLDHMSDLLPILTARWLMGFPKATVYGPEGTRQFLAQMLDLFPYVRNHVSIRTQDLAAGSTYSLGGFEVSIMAMRHHVPSLTYRFDRKLVICGDSEPLAKLKTFAHGCRVLIHECSLLDGQLDPGHAAPTALGRALAGATVDWLLLTHLYPQATAKAEQLVKSVQKHFHGRVSVATDLQMLEL